MQHRSLYALTLAAGLALPGGAQATMSLVTSRSSLGATDRVDWEDTGLIYSRGHPVYLPLDFGITSIGGVRVAVSIPQAPVTGAPPPITAPLVFQTTSASTPTNFASGDSILFTGLQPPSGPPTVPPTPAIGNPGPVTITFAGPVSGAGAQLAIDDMNTGYTIYLSVYDLSDTVVASFQVAGTSSEALDDSAAFLGVTSDARDITRLVYWTSQNEALYGTANRGFGLNRLSLVPEPGGLCVGGLVILIGRRLAARRARSGIG